MVSIENTVGRLIEVRWSNPITKEDEALMLSTTQIVGSHEPKIICSDMRAIKLFPGSITDIIERIAKEHRVDILRSAILIGKNNAIGVLQQTRLQRALPHAREVAHSFDEPAALIEWLSDILTPAERARLEQFLGDTPQKKISLR